MRFEQEIQNCNYEDRQEKEESKGSNRLVAKGHQKEGHLPNRSCSERNIQLSVASREKICNG
jgi:hypothetical protein